MLGIMLIFCLLLLDVYIEKIINEESGQYYSFSPLFVVTVSPSLSLWTMVV